MNGFSLYVYKIYCKIWELRIFFGEFEVESFLAVVRKDIFSKLFFTKFFILIKT